MASGVFAYDPRTEQATTEPVLRTDGTPAVLLPFE